MDKYILFHPFINNLNPKIYIFHTFINAPLLNMLNIVLRWFDDFLALLQKPFFDMRAGIMNSWIFRDISNFFLRIY